MNVDDFLLAQDGGVLGLASYTVALAELKQGKKRSHFIWYVFPIVRGLRESSTARRFALEGPDDAVTYLRHPLLRARLLESTAALRAHVPGRPLARVLGDDVDAGKVVSSLGLFVPVARRLVRAGDPGLQAFVDDGEALLEAAQAEGLPPCAHTASLVSAWPGPTDA